MFKSLISAFAFIALFQSAAQADPACTGALTDAERQSLARSANPVMKTCPGKDANEPWGRVWVYTWSRSTPEEAAAVYSDYANQQTYMPGMRVSQISEEACPTTTKMYFVINTPAVRDEKQFMWHRLSRNGNSYRIGFRLAAPSTFMRMISGDINFSPLEGGTLITHRDVITPGALALRFGSASDANNNLLSTVRGMTQHMDSQHGSVNALIARMNQKLQTPPCEIR